MHPKALLKHIFRPGPEEQRPQAGARFGISWPLLAALSLVLVCAVGWAFFMGLMVGRGQNPQASVHAVTGFMKPEEPAKAEPLDVLPEPFPVAEPVIHAAPAPAAPQKAIKASKPEKSQPKAATVAKKQAPEKKYAYTFQAGAFKSQSEAKAASAKLNRNGLKSSVRKSGKVWLVVISLEGGPSDVAAMRQKAKNLKMDRPMQLSRTAIEPKKRKNG